jgi:hypothetical protein
MATVPRRLPTALITNASGSFEERAARVPDLTFLAAIKLNEQLPFSLHEKQLPCICDDKTLKFQPGKCMGKSPQSLRQKLFRPMTKSIGKSTSTPLSERYAELLRLRKAVAQAKLRSKETHVRCPTG